MINNTGAGQAKEPFVFRLSGNEFAVYMVDCLRGMKENLASGSVDVVVTSPPYNLGIKYSQYDDSMKRDNYLTWLGEWAGVLKTTMSDEGSLFLNLGSKPTEPWGPFEVLFEMRKHFALQNVIHWVKSIAIEKEDVGDYPGITKDVSVGHYKPIQGPRFVNDCHEYIFHLTKNGRVELDRLAIGVEYQDKSNLDRWESASEGQRCRGNTWFVPYKTIKNRQSQRPHPATFPIKIPRMCIMLHGLAKTRLVMVPFLGIGHTALACIELGVNFVGFEIDKEYYSESCEAMVRHEGRIISGIGRGNQGQLPLL